MQKTPAQAEQEFFDHNITELLLDVLFDDFAEDGHALYDLLFGHAGVVQADAVIVASIGEEAVAGNVSNVALEALLCHLVGVDVLGKLDPGEQAAVGVSELCLGREFLFHGLDHDIAALAIALFDGCNVLVKVIHVDELGNNELSLGGGLQGCSLSEEVVLLEDLAVCADPAETVAGSEDLGEGAEEYYEALGVHALECGQVLAFEAELAVGVILNNGNLVLVYDLHELLAALEGPGAAGGVLEVGDNIDHLDVLGGSQNLFELFHDHAVAVGGDSDEVGLAGLKGVECAEVGRALDDDDITLIAEYASGVIQTLLRAGGHEDVVSAGLDVELCFHAVSDLLTEVLEAVGAGVLESNSALLFKNSVGSGLDLVDREKLGSGHAACKGEDLGLIGQCEELTDCRTLEKVHSA